MTRRSCVDSVPQRENLAWRLRFQRQEKRAGNPPPEAGCIIGQQPDKQRINLEAMPGHTILTYLTRIKARFAKRPPASGAATGLKMVLREIPRSKNLY